jgi:hypothetical protein
MDEVSWGQQALDYLRIGLLQLELHAGLAAWLQAVGIVAALAAVFWVASAQARRARADRRMDQKRYRGAVVDLAEETVLAVASAAEALARPGEAPDPAYDLRPLEDLSAALLGLSVERLGSGHAILRLHALRRILLEARSLLEQARAEHQRSGAVWPATAEAVQRCAREAKAAAEALRKAL